MTEHAVEVAQPLELPAVVRRRLTSAELAGLAGLGAIALLPIPFGSFGFFVGQYALIYAILGLSVVVVTGYAGLVSLMTYSFAGLRSGRVGRALLAVRTNEREAQALGINVYKTKLTAFLTSGVLGGIGGALLALLLTSVTRSAFQSPLVEATSILLVTVVVVGGIDRALGAFLGAVALVVQQQVFQGARFFFAYFGIYSAALLVLFL